MSGLPEDIHEMREGLDTNDVGQKRYIMNTIFDRLLNHRYSNEEMDFEHEEKISELQNLDGYMYKLAQDFLTSSSTFEKQQKLEKLMDYLD